MKVRIGMIFKWCSCKSVAVDGGKDYLKRSFTKDSNDYTDLSEYEELNNKGE